MPGIVKAEIYSDGEYYCARTLDIDVFTQGRTMDEAVENLKEAVSMHLEDEADYGLQEVSSILAMVKVAIVVCIARYSSVVKSMEGGYAN